MSIGPIGIVSRRSLLRMSGFVGIAGAAYLSGSWMVGAVSDGTSLDMPFGIDKEALFRGLVQGYVGVDLAPNKSQGKLGEHWERSEQPWFATLATIDRVRAAINHTMPSLFADLNLALSVLEFAPLVDGVGGRGGGGRFSRLSPQEQEAFLITWQTSSLDFKAEIAYGLRPLFLLSWYEQDEVKARLGIEPLGVQRNRWPGTSKTIARPQPAVMDHTSKNRELRF